MEEEIKNLEKTISYVFTDKELLQLALTHTSYINEHHLNKNKSNQRIEFLGDAVLELITSEFIYKNYRDMAEGELTKLRAKLVCEDSLSELAIELELYKYLKVGKGEKDLSKNKSIMCDTFESVVGAMYLDSDFETVSKFVKRFLFTEDRLNSRNSDFKSLLQEYLHTIDKTAEYRCIDEKGPDHEKCFTMALFVDDELISQADGSSKKHAEQLAAEIGLKHYKVGVK